MAYDAGSETAHVEIVLAPEPFTTRVERLEAQEGATVAHILTEACRLEVLDPQDLARVEVYLDGERLKDRVAAMDVRPAPGQLLNVVVLPQGGGGGHNKVMSTVLEVALIAATAWVAGPGGSELSEIVGLPLAPNLVRFGTIASLALGGSMQLQELIA